MTRWAQTAAAVALVLWLLVDYGFGAMVGGVLLFGLGLFFDD